MNKKGAVEFSMTTIIVVIILVIILSIVISWFTGDSQECSEKDIEEGLCEITYKNPECPPDKEEVNGFIAGCEYFVLYGTDDSRYKEGQYNYYHKVDFIPKDTFEIKINGKEQFFGIFSNNPIIEVNPKSECQLLIENKETIHYEKFGRTLHSMIQKYPQCENFELSRDGWFINIYTFDCPKINIDFDSECFCEEEEIFEIKLPKNYGGKCHLDTSTIEYVEHTRKDIKFVIKENCVTEKHICTQAREKTFQDLNCDELNDLTFYEDVAHVEQHNYGDDIHLHNIHLHNPDGSHVGELQVLRKQLELRCFE